MSRRAAVSAESVDTEDDTHTNGETREAPAVTESSVTADTTSSNSTAKSPAQIKEEKRKAIQAARLQRERELAALLAEEQALMEGDSIVFFIELVICGVSMGTYSGISLWFIFLLCYPSPIITESFVLLWILELWIKQG